jgi:uncharacterized protein (DUF952 family)
MSITYHGTPVDHFTCYLSAPYLPLDFGRDGFIHCTDGREAVSIVLTLYHKSHPGAWLVLYIDTERVTAPIRYDDPAEVFPHIYGPLNRDAIVAVSEIARSEDGTFLKPPPLPLLV